MTKSELIDRLAAQFPQLVAKDAELAVKMILEAMAESLAKGERIEIRGFGSFGLNYRPPRTGRNPKSGDKVQVLKSTSRISRRARNCASGWTSRARDAGPALGRRKHHLSGAPVPFAAELGARDPQVLPLVELAGAADIRRPHRVRDRSGGGTSRRRNALRAAVAPAHPAAPRAAPQRGC